MPPATYGRLRYGVEEHGRGRGVWLLELEPHVMLRVKRMFPRVAQERSGVLWIYDSPEVARDLEWLLLRWPLKVHRDTKRTLKAHAAEHKAIEGKVAEILAGHTPPSEWKDPVRPLRDYQLAADAVAAATGRLLLLDDVGLGKTASALARFRDPDALPGLFVTLTHLPEQMLTELNTIMPWLDGHVIRRTTPYDPLSMRGVTRQPDVLFTSYSKLATWGPHLAGKVRTVIFDEIQELRTGPASGGKPVQKYVGGAMVADQATCREGLSATPIYNYGDETFNVVDILAPGVLGSKDEFLREWCVPVGNGKHKVRDPPALGTYLRAEGILLRRTRKQVGRELPETINVPHTVPLDEKVLAALEDSADVTAFADLVLRGDRQQRFRASGELDWRMRRATGVAKAPYVAEFVRLLLESEEKVVLFGWHHDVYDIWRWNLRDFNPAWYTGKETPQHKRRAKDAFVNGDSRVLIMSLRAGAGLDGIQKVVKVGVFGELDWSPGVHLQCVGRYRRDGAMSDSEPPVAYYLVAESGSDPVVMEVLGVKRGQSDPMLDPDAPLSSPAADTADRIRRLAASVLKRR